MPPGPQEEVGERGDAPRPPLDVPPLRAWWIVAAGVVVALLFVLTDHILRATVALSGTLFLAAVLRLALPPERAGGVVVRGPRTDVAVLVVLGGLVLLSGFTLDLTAR